MIPPSLPAARPRPSASRHIEARLAAGAKFDLTLPAEPWQAAGHGPGVLHQVLAQQYEAAHLVTRRTGSAEMALLRANVPAWQLRGNVPAIDAYQLTVDLSPGGRRRGVTETCVDWEVPTQRHRISIADLEALPPTSVRGRFHALSLLIPREVLKRHAHNASSRPSTLFACAPDTVDPVIGALATAVAEVMQVTTYDPASHLDDLFNAILAHVVASYSCKTDTPSRGQATLARWQQNHAKELLAACVTKPMKMADVAAECRLSRGHFTRAFKHSTGQTPHAWLTAYRISQSKSLLDRSDLCLAEIALMCGFSDQSHFTRVFHRIVGVSPGRWRRAQEPQ